MNSNITLETIFFKSVYTPKHNLKALNKFCLSNISASDWKECNLEAMGDSDYTLNEKICKSLYKRRKMIFSCAERVLREAFCLFKIREVYIRIEPKEVWCVLKEDYVNDEILEEFYNKTFEISDEILFFVDGAKEIDLNNIPHYDKKIEGR